MRYFNYAGLSPTRPEVVNEMQAVSNEFRTRLFSQSGIAWYRTQVEMCRQRVAQLLHAHLGEGGDSLMFVPNATTAYSIALSRLHLQRGDLVIISDQEHPAIGYALSRLRERGIEVTVIPADTEGRFLTRLDDVCQQGRARLITLSHVAHTDGRLFPLKQVCEIAGRRQIMLGIDGAQAVGHVPVDLGTLAVDFYFFSGHKWCGGPMGTGALLMTRRYKERHKHRESDPAATGLAQEYFDLGTQNIGLIAGFAKACDLTQQDLPAMAGLARLRTLFREGLSRLPGVEIAEWDGLHAPGILSFRVKEAGFDATRIAEHLNVKHDIAIKPMAYPESKPLLRVSWSLSTDAHEPEVLADKLKETLKFLSQQAS